MPAETDVYLGVVFNLEGQQIGLEPINAINKVQQTGLECGLNQPVALGEVGPRIKGLIDTLGADPSELFETDGSVKQSIKDLPVIGEIIDGILTAQVTVEQFHLKIPPKNSNLETRYTVGMSAAWDVAAGKGKLFGNLYLQGVYLKVSNEGVTTAPAVAPANP